MSYRVFKRQVWKSNPSWPHGFEPLATCMDDCRTLATCYSSQEAIEFCDERNDVWREADDNSRKYYTADRYEWTEV